MKKMNGIGLVLAFVTLMTGCAEYSKFDITEKPFVDKTSVELYVGEHAGKRSQIQLTSSPSDRKYTWTSLAPDVASVDQNGLVTAHIEGYTVITVVSENDRTDINVRVLEFVPLVDFTLDRSEYSGVVQDMFLLLAMPEPSNASVMDIQWTSSNEKVAHVFSNGLVKITGVGESIITARTNGITRTITVFSKLKFQITSANIPNEGIYAPSVQTPTWGYSSQQAAYPLTNLFDGNPASFWHGAYSGSYVSNYPHWFIVDLRRTVIITDMMIQRRQNFVSCNGFYFYVCPDVDVDQSDPLNGYPWELQGEYTFDPQTNNEQWYKMPNVEARYITLYFDPKHKDSAATNNYIQLAEFGIYGY
ncbi:MAG: Ig-like domain-containing protein [Bacteroidales bacterium]|nr:Ig-like domain-containing protein [Bacteroidales bacterium]